MSQLGLEAFGSLGTSSDGSQVHFVSFMLIDMSISTRVTSVTSGATA